MACRIEFEDLDKWKIWFDAGNESELVSALAVIERTVEMTGSNSTYSEERKPYIDYARKKLNERFHNWDCPF